MAEYRIKKGDRVYLCRKLGTVQTLIARGMVKGGDPVSRDGGAWVRAEDVEEFGALIALSADVPPPVGDPWSQPTLVPDDVQPADRLLDEFLSAVASGPLPAVDLPPRGLGPRPPPPLSPPAPSRPPPPAKLGAPADEDLPELDASSIASIVSTAPPAVPPKGLPLPSPADPAGASVPSFQDWMAGRKDDEGKRLLQALGGSDLPTLTVPSADQPVVRWARVTLIGGVALFAILLVHTWVKTGASTPYPTEDELVARRRREASLPLPGDSPAAEEPPSAPSPRRRLDTPWNIDRPAPTPAGANPDQARENAMRQRVSPRLEEVQDAAHYEDVLFTELSNLGSAPRKVGVTVLRGTTSASGREGRPIEVDVTIALAPSPSLGDAASDIRERVTLLLFVVGKYAHQGGISVGRLSVSVQAPTPWSRDFDGRTLPALWSGRFRSAELFLSE